MELIEVGFGSWSRIKHPRAKKVGLAGPTGRRRVVYEIDMEFIMVSDDYDPSLDPGALQVGRSQVEAAMSQVFQVLWPQEDWNAEHLADTPDRFVRMLVELTTPPDIKWKTFASDADEMVVVKDIPFSSLCAHHLVPFAGRAHVAYVPNGRICGLSKLARVVHHFAAGLQVQEELTSQIANYLNDKLSLMEPQHSHSHDYTQHYPVGVAVVMEAEHFCMSLRGVKVHGTETITSKMLGCFADHSRQARTEFLQLIRS